MTTSCGEPNPSVSFPYTRKAWDYCAARLLPPCSTAISSSPDSSTLLFETFIVKHYTEPGRHYHSMLHLEEMFTYLKQYEEMHGWASQAEAALSCDALKGSPQSKDGDDDVAHKWRHLVLCLSVLFHDVIYDVRRKDNELASANLALSFLDEAERLSRAAAANEKLHNADAASTLWMCAPSDAVYVRQTVRVYILKTCDHLSVPPRRQLFTSPDCGVTSADKESTKDENCADDPLHVFLDLDLSILGCPDPVLYRDRYAKGIQQEYCTTITYPQFVEGRHKFLTGLLVHRQWFKTPFFFHLLESTARQNVATELETLSRQLHDLQTATASAPAAV